MEVGVFEALSPLAWIGFGLATILGVAVAGAVS